MIDRDQQTEERSAVVRLPEVEETTLDDEPGANATLVIGRRAAIERLKGRLALNVALCASGG